MTIAAGLKAMPVTVIGGYLGAGKTTLVNHLLRHAAGRRIAVLVNDFGELPIDADLIESTASNVIGIAGGCVCCSYGSDLIGALEDLLELQPRPDHVLVETSGVGLPGAVASSITLVTGYRIDGLLVLADADSVRRRVNDPYMSDTVLRQLAQADLVVLNKTDLVDADTRRSLSRWLREVVEGKPVVEIEAGRLPPEVAFGPDLRPPEPRLSLTALPAPTAGSAVVAGPHAQHTTMFASVSFHLDGPVAVEVLAAGLAGLQPELLRAKGIVRNADGTVMLLQVVGTRHHVEPAPVTLTGPGRLAAIGRAGEICPARLTALIESAGGAVVGDPAPI